MRIPRSTEHDARNKINRTKYTKEYIRMKSLARGVPFLGFIRRKLGVAAMKAQCLTLFGRLDSIKRLCKAD